MSLRFVVVIALFLFSCGGTYLLGMSNARQEQEALCRSAMGNIAAQDAAAEFLLSTRALEHLESAHPELARTALIQSAQLKASTLSECLKSEACTATLGQLRPSQEKLSRVVSMKVAGQ
jgi:hypothetical protein